MTLLQLLAPPVLSTIISLSSALSPLGCAGRAARARALVELPPTPPVAAEPLRPAGVAWTEGQVRFGDLARGSGTLQPLRAARPQRAER